MNHSIADAVAFAIRTPVGTVVMHRRLQDRPHVPRRHDGPGAASASWASEGVLALLADSTNVERPGYTPVEERGRRQL